MILNKPLQLNINSNIFNPIYLDNDNLFDYSHRFNLYYGGAGSGKSRYVIQKLVIKALLRKQRMIFCRRYGVTLKNSVMEETRNVLKQLGIIQFCNLSDGNRTYTLPNGSEIIFLGLDDEYKLLSLSNVTTAFLEETYEIEESKFDQVNLRLRGTDDVNEIYCSWNPISATSYLYNKVTDPVTHFGKDKYFILKTTYRDNRFLTQEYVNSIEQMRLTNYKKYVVFGLGEWGSNQDLLVYKNNIYYQDFNIQKVLKLPKIDVRLGLDFGYVDPMALSVSAFDHPKQRIFVIDEHYETGMTLDNVYDMLVRKRINNTRNKFYGDSEDARAMAFLRNKGVRIEPVKKVKVTQGISFLQNWKIIVHPSCTNHIYEFKNYTHKVDKVSGKPIEDQFEGPDHLMDAIRYAASDLYNQTKPVDSGMFFKF